MVKTQSWDRSSARAAPVKLEVEGQILEGVAPVSDELDKGKVVQEIQVQDE